tara:strand:+ start:390 stop:647 length:258 start_codon:yes stop_codon:yes gene_type:complete
MRSSLQKANEAIRVHMTDRQGCSLHSQWLITPDAIALLQKDNIPIYQIGILQRILKTILNGFLNIADIFWNRFPLRPVFSAKITT